MQNPDEGIMLFNLFLDYSQDTRQIKKKRKKEKPLPCPNQW